MRNRILLVDDEPTNLNLLEAILTQSGYESIRAPNGFEALAILEKEAVDLVLLDLMMPGMDGIEVLRRVRTSAGKPWIPIILVTAAHEREARLRAFDAGADEFLEKPIDRPLLLTRTRTLLRLREAREAVEERARALEELHIARQELVGLIVHDLKNPLSIIRNNVSYAERHAVPGSSDYREALEDATLATDRMMGLVVDILSVERMDSHDSPIVRTEFNIASLVADVSRAHQREIQMHDVKLSSVLADAKVSADPELVRRAVENLVENALRHTPSKGNIEISVEANVQVAVVVSNTGRPIPENVRANLFEKYAKGGGTGYRFGLGLYFCRRVADACGGTVAVVERAGWPVSFRFALPAI